MKFSLKYKSSKISLLIFLLFVLLSNLNYLNCSSYKAKVIIYQPDEKSQSPALNKFSYKIINIDENAIVAYHSQDPNSPVKY